MAEEATQAAEEQAPIQLGLNDLAAVIQIIDVCSKRGAFEGPELASVGQVRGRIAAFVEANAPKKEEGGETAAAEEEAPAEDNG
jgi:hypothetical protein